ncbi:hypothetical protein N825_21875 [Skermanella stibiiresistens SB22]|uniref:Glycosyltransferase n=1 Tax=Skermanella stibiiresistens SB22 TaxID=1385369 RepID=W9H031_9PROT|nr:glycosyltransferase [Skermanella stibiiresistens]EWY37098.1 hypothetical protein N825_21875 [Skermanella stibiiresistens SB22]
MPDPVELCPAVTPPASGPLTVVVAIATKGRPETVGQTIAQLEHQTRRPDLVIVCAPEERDIVGLRCRFPEVKVLLGGRGLAHQRNEMLRAVDSFDIAIFLDDDFLAGRGYVEATERAFLKDPGVVMVTGTVVKDGILGPGFSHSTALAYLDEAEESATPEADEWTEVYNGYGCNMSVHLLAARAAGALFDEGLPLYAWLEDVDFSRQMARHGRIIRISSAFGVHRGVKGGRQSGVKLGYSQIANPIYLARKGTCSWRKACFLMSRNMMANAARSFRPEPYVDRIGRVIGNLRALLDLITGRLRPSRISSL